VETRPWVAVHNPYVRGTHQLARELAHGGSADAERPVERRSFRSLDQTESVESTAVRPDSYAAAASALAASHGAIPRGQGLSYCLASAGEGSTSILTSGLDRILHLDADARTIEVEAGLTLGELARFEVSKGLWFPVLPGYPTITIEIERPGVAWAFADFGSRNVALPGPYYRARDDRACWDNPDTGSRICAW
jgi:hypothetical protein